MTIVVIPGCLPTSCPGTELSPSSRSWTIPPTAPRRSGSDSRCRRPETGLLPEPSESTSDTVQSDGNKLSLRAVLHYLWDEAELTTWHAAFAGHRSWAVVHQRLRAAVDGKLVRKNPL